MFPFIKKGLPVKFYFGFILLFGQAADPIVILVPRFLC